MPAAFWRRGNIALAVERGELQKDIIWRVPVAPATWDVARATFPVALEDPLNPFVKYCRSHEQNLTNLSGKGSGVGKTKKK